MWATTARLLAASAARSTAAPSTSGRTVLTAGHRLASTRVTVRLTTAVDGLGGPGETAAVRPGHARNFLIPQGLAIMEVATPPPSPSASATPAADDAAAAQRRLASVVRQLTRGEVEIVRSSTARDGSFTPGIGPDEIVAAVAEQKRISLDPALFAPPAPSITRQGRHEVPLRILSGRSGGSTEERVVLRVAVGAAAAGPASTEGGGDDEERKKGGKK